MPDPASLQLLAIAGPTAVGKSEVALEIARRIGGEIVSVDSMQVYRRMDIGTAKPSTEERGQVPHHLLDIRNVTAPFDAAQFVQLARAAIEEISARGRIAILCGGTGLYFNALISGLGEAPAADPQVREALSRVGLSDLLTELAARDPATFEQIDRKNRRRVVRALEVIRVTGRPFSELRAQWDEAGRNSEFGPGPGRVWVGLKRHVSDLRRRIDVRVEEMFRRGLVQETETLLAAGLADNPTASQALGYRQVCEHLQETRPLEETVQLVKIRTWQYAKKQMTWFRRRLNLSWLELDPNEPAAETAGRVLALTSHPATQ